MIGRDTLATDGLIPAAQPARDIIVDANDEESPRRLRCAICGASHSAGVELPVGYSNPVCNECDRLGVNDAGDPPWHGYPPGEWPDDDDGVIHMPPDHGQNPVYIAGVRCFRRYRFGGWITRRDAYDSPDLEAFPDRHRVGGRWIHAFNEPHPQGVELPENADALIAELTELREVESLARGVADGADSSDVLRSRVHDLPSEIRDSLPSPEGEPDAEWAAGIADRLERIVTGPIDQTGPQRWILDAKLCERYRSEE